MYQSSCNIIVTKAVSLISDFERNIVFVLLMIQFINGYEYPFLRKKCFLLYNKLFEIIKDEYFRLELLM
jgi:hypothetical protein